MDCTTGIHHHFSPPFGSTDFWVTFSRHRGWLQIQDKDGTSMFSYVASMGLDSTPIVFLYVPWSKVAILGMVIPPLIGILIIGI